MARGCGGLCRPTLAGVAVLVVVLACASAASAAPQSPRDAADNLMKAFMTQWDKHGFAKVVDLGNVKSYRARLAQCKIKVDAALRSADGTTPNAVYGPEPNVITFSRDPRKLPASARAAWGETVWHEVTHALEAFHGDDMTNGDKLYRDRHTRYMTSVATEALPFLDQLEKKAKTGASAADLTTIWDTFIEKVKDAAENLPETQKYPPDLTQMKQWFGFTADPETVRRMYLTDVRFSGPTWANLRAALSAPAFKPSDWAGRWYSYNLHLGDLTLTVSGSSVAGVWDDGYYNHDFKGAISSDGGTMTGSWVNDTNLASTGVRLVYDYSVALKIVPASGIYSFDGFYWNADNIDALFPFTAYRDRE